MMLNWLFSTRAQWLGFCLGAGVVIAATLAPAAQLTSVPGTDKIHHILGFFGWASLCALGPSRRFIIMSLIIIMMGGLIELLQPYVNRYADWYDFWADVAGVALAYVVHAVALLFKQRQGIR